ncbi:hypothetical protein C8N46_11362 [Kordia periserrulae]|uniref:Uncharacterized protein n=1 Tax=Kordia periserrulae TaxID=701523 RepID=A0A2T6BR47_9FLAO|nr:hypothetical protein [Kordia periserrulae]PTX58571.1 hypothetical protein C8N46_11362 [Kordia periserrulae]
MAESSDSLILREKMIEYIHSQYKSIEHMVCEVIPENGYKLINPEQYKKDMMIYFSDKHAQDIVADGRISRAEFLGILAAKSNYYNTYYKLAKHQDPETFKASVKNMALKMEKWGLDISNPYEKEMIEGLTRLNIFVLNHKNFEKSIEEAHEKDGEDFTEKDRSNLRWQFNQMNQALRTDKAEPVTHNLKYQLSSDAPKL